MITQEQYELMQELVLDWDGNDSNRLAVRTGQAMRDLLAAITLKPWSFLQEDLAFTDQPEMIEAVDDVIADEPNDERDAAIRYVVGGGFDALLARRLGNLYSHAAAECYDVALTDVTLSQRNWLKVTAFGRMYGGPPRGLGSC